MQASPLYTYSAKHCTQAWGEAKTKHTVLSVSHNPRLRSFRSRYRCSCPEIVALGGCGPITWKSDTEIPQGPGGVTETA